MVTSWASLTTKPCAAVKAASRPSTLILVRGRMRPRPRQLERTRHMKQLKLDGQVIATGLRFPEGPVALSDGSVLVTEIAAGTLARVSSNGTVDVVAQLGGGPNGAAI